MNHQAIRTICGIAMLSASFGVFAADCRNPGTSLEISLCLGQELRESDAKINQSYQKLMGKLSGADRLALRAQQRAWIKRRDSACDLDEKQTDREKWYAELLRDYGKTVCVSKYTRQRTAELDRMLQTLSVQPEAAAESRREAAAPGKTTDLAYDNRPATVHEKGRWYFELRIDYRKVVDIGPIVLAVGAWDNKHMTGTLANIRAQDAGKDPGTIGIAVDLDNGKLYTSYDGMWREGAPGSNEGLDLKLGRRYYGSFMLSAVDQKPYLESGALVPNFGDRPLTYALPAGYRAWRDVNSAP